MNVLITGTSKGIGKALTLEFLRQGHEVFALSRNNDAELQTFKNYYFQSIDLTNFSKIEETVPHFIAGAKNIDLVILNAGVLNEIKDLKDTSIEEIKKVMDLNVWANKILLETLFFTKKDIKQVIAISSGASVSGARGWNAYSLSKATLNMLINL
ncbi:MAG: SDR family NAD(P)-dependent oxidoreductase, partial [Cyclobacteriaceae bacterium]